MANGETTARCTAVLKSDAFGRVELLEFGSERRVRRVASGCAWPASAFLARRLLERERRALLALGSMPGAPRLEHGQVWLDAEGADGRVPPAAACLVRAHIEGRSLSQTAYLPRDFFVRLRELVGTVHAAGVCHNDLHKEQNILVDADGWPALIDFQLASLHARPGRAFRSRGRDDLRHVEKHERRYTRAGRAPADIVPARGPRTPRSLPAWVWRRLVKPLYDVLRAPLRPRGGGEVRRPSSGPWPEWVAPRGERPQRQA